MAAVAAFLAIFNLIILHTLKKDHFKAKYARRRPPPGTSYKQQEGDGEVKRERERKKKKNRKSEKAKRRGGKAREKESLFVHLKTIKTRIFLNY